MSGAVQDRHPVSGFGVWISARSRGSSQNHGPARVIYAGLEVSESRMILWPQSSVSSSYQKHTPVLLGCPCSRKPYTSEDSEEQLVPKSRQRTPKTRDSSHTLQALQGLGSVLTR